MKTEQKQQARNLYFESGLNKTQIAERLGINRRTVMLWCQEGNWERLRQSSRHMPSLVAEKCYFLLDQYTTRFLDGYNITNFTEKHADAINKLASGIKKLKNRSAVNESMEMFNYFLESLNKNDPQLAALIQPHIEEYIASRKDVNTLDFLPPGFDPDVSIPFPTTELQEQYQDQSDVAAFRSEMKAANNDYDIAIQNWQNAQHPGDDTSVPEASPAPIPVTPI